MESRDYMHCPKCGGKVKSNKCERCGNTLTKIEKIYIEETYSSLYIFCFFLGLCLIALGIFLIKSYFNETGIIILFFGIPCIITGIICSIYGIIKKLKERHWMKYLLIVMIEISNQDPL